MTTSPTDPNQVRLTGENSFIRLSQDEGATQTTRSSHWRILLSPAGPGHVFFSRATKRTMRYGFTPTTSPWPAGCKRKSSVCSFPNLPTRIFP